MVFKKMKYLIFIFLLINISLFSKHLNKEIVYQNHFAKYINGKTEHVLSDKTRIDILTNDYAIEIDFANKWAEAVGQALYYSIMAKKLPGIVLIIETENDYKHLLRLISILNDLNNNGYEFSLWIIDENFKISRRIL